VIKPVDALTISFHRSVWSKVPLRIFFLFLFFLAKYAYYTFRAKRSFIERYQLSLSLSQATRRFAKPDDRRDRHRFWSRKIQRIITTATMTIVRTRSNLIHKRGPAGLAPFLSECLIARSHSLLVVFP